MQTEAEDRRGESVSVDALLRIDRLCQDFEQEWKEGRTPRIEDYISASEGVERRRLVRELLLLELDYRQTREERPTPDAYVARFPAEQSVIEAAFANSAGMPERIGAYRILRVLGEGGMGTVYLAEQESPMRRLVALKVTKQGMDTKEVIRRFEGERQALAVMDHPSIAKVFDAGTTATGQPYFAMEYVRGTSITQYCDAHALTIAERLGLFLQVCRGVQHAHEQGIIHRDIKPANILVSSVDERPVAKIIDFGIAKATNPWILGTTMYSREGRFIGTPEYMSPEQAGSGAEGVDCRTDVYSLGVLLYELLVGEVPLSLDAEKIALDEIVRRIRDEEPPTPSVRWTRCNLDRTRVLATWRGTNPGALRGDLRGELDWITMKALEKKPVRRYASVADLKDDIERHLKNEAVRAGPPSAVYRIRKYVHRHAAMVAATSSVMLALALGLAASAWFAFIASSRLEDVLRLSDIVDIESHRTESDALWPAVSENVGAMEAWISKARRVADRLEVHRRTLERLRERALPYSAEAEMRDRLSHPSAGKLARLIAQQEEEEEDGEDIAKLTSEISILEREVRVRRTWEFAARQDQWWHRTLVALIESMDSFVKGPLVDVEKRLEFAKSVRQKTIDDVRARWDAAIASIKDKSQSPRYDGLEIVAQEGFIPLHEDRGSGLWEFAHLQTGEPPAWDSEGKLVLAAHTGLVFVLLPGGTFRMGAEKPDEARSLGSPNSDPFANELEKPSHDVTLSPFLLSKYEMTQAQWERFTGSNPSRWTASNLKEQLEIVVSSTALHPVESVNWVEADRALRQLGLMLPTEAQMEYAIRGGTHTVWWTGNELSMLAGACNIADLTAQRAGFKLECTEDPALEDGYHMLAPVGTFRPNGFGLHDVCGNVYEWCRDWQGTYKRPVRQGDGERQVDVVENIPRTARGGSFCDVAAECRSARRGDFEAEGRYHYLGVRPAAALRLK